MMSSTDPMRPEGELRVTLPATRPIAKPGEVRSWLEAHVSHAGEDCLIFPFCRNSKGYGSVRIDAQYMRAHQWMCKAAHGENHPDKPFALPSCGNGHLGCVNPSHLYWGSAAQNYQDQVRHGVAARGARNGRSLLCEAQVRQIRALRSEGMGLDAIASLVAADRECVRSVVRGRTWVWLA